MMAKKYLRLITLNTWKGDGRYGRRLGLMAKGLKALQPDIVCLQECLRTPGAKMDTAGYLGRALDLNVTFGPGRCKKRYIEGEQHTSHSGLAILSRVEPLDFQHLALPACVADPDRSFLSALYTIDGYLITVTNVHLTHLKAEDKLRKEQLRATIEATRLFRKHSKKTNTIEHHKSLSFVCGDLNWQFQDTEREVFEEAFDFRIDDCYLNGGGELPGHTFGLDGNSPQRLDYILSLAGFDEQSPSCKNGKCILKDKAKDGLSASDHLGVMIDIEL